MSRGLNAARRKLVRRLPCSSLRNCSRLTNRIRGNGNSTVLGLLSGSRNVHHKCFPNELFLSDKAHRPLCPGRVCRSILSRVLRQLNEELPWLILIPTYLCASRKSTAIKRFLARSQNTLFPMPPSANFPAESHMQPICVLTSNRRTSRYFFPAGTSTDSVTSVRLSTRWSLTMNRITACMTTPPRANSFPPQFPCVARNRLGLRFVLWGQTYRGDGFCKTIGLGSD